MMICEVREVAVAGVGWEKHLVPLETATSITAVFSHQRIYTTLLPIARRHNPVASVSSKVN